jgi:hypothetical protein
LLPALSRERRPETGNQEKVAVMQSAVAKPFPSASASTPGQPARLRSLLALLGVLLAVAALVGIGCFANARLYGNQAEVQAQQEPVYLPNVRFLRLAALGYDNALADVLWFRTINYFGKHFRGDRLYPWLARMCDLVTDLDPSAEHVYRFAGFVLPWEAQLPDEGIRLLQKGVTHFPDSWQLHFYLGFNLFYFKDDAEGALPHIRRAAELPGADPYVSRFGAMLYSQQYGTAMARDFLEELRRSGGAGGMEQVIDERLRDIELSEHIALLEDGVRRYRERHGREPARLDDLVSGGVINAVPVEPFGHAYEYVAASGEVHSTSGRRPLRVYDSERRRQVLRGENYRD